MFVYFLKSFSSHTIIVNKTIFIRSQFNAETVKLTKLVSFFIYFMHLFSPSFHFLQCEEKKKFFVRTATGCNSANLVITIVLHTRMYLIARTLFYIIHRLGEQQSSFQLYFQFKDQSGQRL